MTKAEMLHFLEPFTDDVELCIWSDVKGVWMPAHADATYSARLGRTTIWLTTDGKKIPGGSK